MLPVRQFGVLGFQLAKVVAILENVGFSASKSQVPAADWSGPRNFKKSATSRQQGSCTWAVLSVSRPLQIKSISSTRLGLGFTAPLSLK
jgi:hypothetical protein